MEECKVVLCSVVGGEGEGELVGEGEDIGVKTKNNHPRTARR